MPESPHDSLPRSDTGGAGRLSIFTKSVWGLGDFTTNTVLTSLSLVYSSYFLIEIAGLRPVLAGLIPLIGRAVDAFTDPLMGRISDRTEWSMGRRRPYFLIGALPFGMAFAMLWNLAPFDGQWLQFAYYAALYCVLSLAVTVLSVPYLALQPEMALDYDERTSLNTYRNLGATFGLAMAVGLRPMAAALGDGAAGFAAAGTILGVLCTLPWFAVYVVSFERPAFRERAAEISFADSLRYLASHRSFARLAGAYLCGRIAMDLMGALLIVYFTYWLGRSGDFEIMMGLFLISVAASLPAWLWMSRHTDKAQMFFVGSVWWMASMLGMLFVQPDWPRWVIFVIGPLTGIGYGAVDLMPWAMVGEVIDEDDLLSGERREGLYNGVFTFVRKLGGAIAVAGALAILDVAGLAQANEPSQALLTSIRYMTTLGPVLFLAMSICFLRGYPLTREVHATNLERLAERDRI